MEFKSQKSYFDYQEFYQNLLKEHKMMCGYIIKTGYMPDILTPNFYFLLDALEELHADRPDDEVRVIKFMDYKAPYKETIVFDSGTVTDALKWAREEFNKHRY